MFSPKNHIQMRTEGERPLYTEYVKVFEKQLDFEYLESTTVTLQMNEATFFDDTFISIL